MADTKVSNLTAVTTIDLTDVLPIVDVPGTSQKKISLSQIRADGVFSALDYGTNGAAIQSAIAAANTAGGGTVLIGPGTWALGGTGLTFPGSKIILQGSGCDATILTYTGSGSAITNSSATTPRTHCGINELTVDITGASAGAIGFLCYNFYLCSYSRLRVNGNGTAFVGVEVRGGAYGSGYTTYWNRFYGLEVDTNGIAVKIGPQEANANQFWGGKWEGNSGQSVVITGTGVNSDTNQFYGVTMQSGGANFIDLASGATDNLFFGCRLEPTAATTVRVQSGAGRNSFINTNYTGNVSWSIAAIGESTYLWNPAAQDYRIDGLNQTDSKKTLQLRGSGAGITWEDNATANIYMRTAGTLRTEGTFEAAGSLVAQQGAAQGVDIGGAGATVEAVGTDTDINLVLTPKGTGRLALQKHRRSINFVIDGSGATITTGVKGFVQVPEQGTIVAARLLADQSGSIVVDIWEDTYANYPPVDADSITSTTPPTITTATKSEDTTLTSWQKTLVRGSILGFNVDSCTTIQRCTVVIDYEET